MYFIFYINITMLIMVRGIPNDGLLFKLRKKKKNDGNKKS